MQVRAPLMIEHRLIERMLALINKEATRIRETKEINPVFIDNAVDSIRVYADKTHHGKEEDILFRDLTQKDMTIEEQKIMGELIQEHVLGRKAVDQLSIGDLPKIEPDRIALRQDSGAKVPEMARPPHNSGVEGNQIRVTAWFSDCCPTGRENDV